MTKNRSGWCLLPKVVVARLKPHCRLCNRKLLAGSIVYRHIHSRGRRSYTCCYCMKERPTSNGGFVMVTQLGLPSKSIEDL